MNQRPLGRQQTVQAHREPPRPGERLLLIAEPFHEKLLFDVVELLGERVGMILDRQGDTLDDCFEQGGRGTRDLAPVWNSRRVASTALSRSRRPVTNSFSVGAKCRQPTSSVTPPSPVTRSVKMP